MKVFVLINEQDTDACNQSTVDLFLDKDAARAEMRRQFDAAVLDWDLDLDHLRDEQECECGEDSAIIRNDPDTTSWRIEEKELDVQVAIRVKGGLVESVYSNAGIDADVYDLDVSDYPDEGEQDEADLREAEMNERISAPGWSAIW